MKSSIFRPVWIWNKKKTVFHVPKIHVCHSIANLDFKLELSSRNAQIGAKSAIQTGVTAQKRSIRIKIVDFFFVHHFVAIYELKL